jgi:hypothetical protein
MNKPGEHNNIRTQGSCCSDYGVGWTDRVRFQAGTGRFYLLHSVYTGSEAHIAFHPVGTKIQSDRWVQLASYTPFGEKVKNS